MSDHDAALDFIRSNHRGVLATVRGDGSPQMSPVVAGVDADGYVVISTRETSVKVRNIARNPRVTYCALNDRFFGEWHMVGGTAEVVHLPEAMDGLVAYYRDNFGEHDNWDEYRAAMEKERRVLLRVTVERSGPTQSG